MILIIDYLIKQKELLEEQVLDKASQIWSLPDGELSARTNGKYSKYYRNINGQTQYLSKKDISLVKALAEKRKLELEKNIIQDKLDAIEVLLNRTEKSEQNLSDFLADPRYDSLLLSTPHNSSDLWTSEDKYKRCKKHPEHLIHPCPSGNIVRSKSEIIIDVALNNMNIPYRYEAELLIDGISYYPDFTLKHPLTGEIIYWEHFGIMDNSQYAYNAYSKLRTYYSSGIIPGKNLILTFETTTRPFTYADAEAALRFMNL